MFRATGITAYLENGGTIEKAQQIAAHESPKTTKLYDRTSDQVTLDEIERIAIQQPESVLALSEIARGDSGMHYWIDAHGPVRAAVAQGILWLDRAVPPGKTGYLAVPTKLNVEAASISDTIGLHTAKSLAKGKTTVALPSGGILKLITKRTAPGHVNQEPILLVYPDERLLEIVDRIEGVTSILVVPWTLTGVKPWLERWQAEKYEPPAD
jgi:hypothetical protein